MNAPFSRSDIAQWNHLRDIHDVQPLNERDRACLDAVRGVLEQFDRLDRFGVNLLHKHFDMASDEILVEQVDEAGRRLVTKPVKVDIVRDEMAAAYETQWHWQRDASGALAQVCVSRCFPGNWQSPGHVSQHTGW
ncbi:hypothetical protein IVB46_41840 [Bradyrhizobium sp. 61]|uniref:hypothetical protein n=1 Tax=Bradyrhizobium sp. 61 TaxID=2782679 RepID=UPI001FF72052|nr:hypothetical protein [Bradyrhizobium sp. 61]MCK1281777.1 hypothetical protein [Bradyrhizobium sp. 61]